MGQMPPPTEARVVTAGHGTEAAMGYSYRARVEQVRVGVFRRRDKWRAVIERYFMSWNDEEWLWPHDTKEEAIADGNRWLDKMEAVPSGEYVTPQEGSE